MRAPSAVSVFRVEDTDAFPAAFAAARASGLPAIVHLVIDPDAILPGLTLGQIRAKALARQSTPAHAD